MALFLFSRGIRPADVVNLEPGATPYPESVIDMLTGGLGWPDGGWPVAMWRAVLGEKRFDYAFRTYIDRWAYKHPTPQDFFRTMNDATGEDLGWFWNEWFYQDWTLDQAVTGVNYTNSDPAQGADITISNNDQMVMPVDIEVTETNGHTGRVHLPVEVWQRSGTWTFHYASTSKIKSVVIDPDNHMPDENRDNNQWPLKTK